jgi:hypothetical protein
MFPPAVVEGGKRLHNFRPPLRNGPGAQAALSGGHGSDLCIFPRKLQPGRREGTDYTLYAANGTTIPIYGGFSQSLNLGLRSEFTCRFVVADVQLPFIGVDLLSYYGLLVDCRNNRLFDGVTSLSTPGNTAPSSFPSVKTIATNATIDSLLVEIPELTRPTGVHREVRQNTTYHIRTTPGQHVACCPRPPCGRQGRIRRHAERRNSTTRRETMVICSSPRAQEGRRLAVVWKLLSPQRTHYPRPLSHPPNPGLRPSPFRLHHLFQN